MYKRTLTILTVLTFVAVIGCQQNPVGESRQTFAGSNESGFVTYMAKTGENVPVDLGGERAIRLYENVVEPFRDLEKNYEAGSMSLQEFDEGARGILKTIAEDEGIVLKSEQLVAHRMLHLLLDDPSASQGPIAHYTNLLVQRESPHAEVIYEALGILEGYWTEEQIKTVADEAIINADVWLGETEEDMHISVDRRSAISTAVKDMSQLVE